MADITFNGMTMEYSFVESQMDAGVKQSVEAELSDYSEQDFLDAYMEAHKAKFGKEFLQN